jgi:predicted DNA binding CopG/RHH family protein
VDDRFYTDAPPEVDEALDYAIKNKKVMKRTEVNFLPTPEEIATMRRKKELISIRVSSDNLDFFKRKAAANGIPYQTMINDLLSEYVNQHRGTR